MKKCIIIGSGLGGLSCGHILARNGYEVTVLEQETQAGGCLQSFVRKGAKFETGMHFIGSAEEGQTLYPLLRYLELENLPLSRLDTTGYDVISMPQGRFAFANGHEAFVETLAVHFPKERDGLHRYLDLVERLAQASPINGHRPTPEQMHLKTEYQMRAVDEVINGFTNDALLRNVLVGNLPLYAGERGQTPFSTHAFITNFYNQSAFRLAGGSDIIAKRLIEGIARRGGRVLTRKRVEHITCNNSKATGVTTADGEHFEADLVIAAIHPTLVMQMLNDTNLIRPAFRQRMLNLPNTKGVFTVYIKFKPQTVPYRNHNLYGYAADTPWQCEQYTADNWPCGFLYVHLSNALAADEQPPNTHQQWATCGEIMSYMRYEEVERWANTRIMHRGEEYEDFKRDRAERLINAVERHAPGLRKGIDCYFTSTPLTYEQYTSTLQGSMYGVAKDVRLGSACHVPSRTRIPNLFFAGQNVNSHGMLGTLVGTLVTCGEVLGEKLKL